MLKLLKYLMEISNLWDHISWIKCNLFCPALKSFSCFKGEAVPLMKLDKQWGWQNALWKSRYLQKSNHKWNHLLIKFRNPLRLKEINKNNLMKFLVNKIVNQIDSSLLFKKQITITIIQMNNIIIIIMTKKNQIKEG